MEKTNQLHTHLKTHAWQAVHWNDRNNFMYIWSPNIDEYIIEENLLTEIPISAIDKIYPYKNTYTRFATETLCVDFKAPYDVYNDFVRINQKELIKLIMRKKKYGNIYITKARRWWYAKLKEE
tara:strand:- start:499 stop:867 length:369 start_codon:yes stop_codon:yes gene_type:complete